MPGRTPQEAFGTYVDALQAALGCITQRRLTLNERTRLRVDTPYALALADMDPVILDHRSKLRLSVGQNFRIVKTDIAAHPFIVRTTAYFYQFSVRRDGRDVDVLDFHWTPEAIGESAVAFPHLHIGAAILANPLFIRAHDFHKIHIPTGCISIEAIVRLAIVEFGVKARSDWEIVLSETEQALSGSIDASPNIVP